MILNYINKESKQINAILKNDLNMSTNLLNKLIKKEKIYLNGQIIDTRKTAINNDIISIDFDYIEDNSNIIPTKMNLDIIYEDEWLLILNKPAGITVHPSTSHYNDSLSNGVKFYFDFINLKKKIRSVNRLDLNTSGLIVFAKNEYIQECLIKQMNLGEFQKEYIALASGNFNINNGIINSPIARKEGSIIERCISPKGKKSITIFEVIKNYKDFSFVKCILKTGRTHQIRVHMASIGHSLLGDTLYGTSCHLINRQALHSHVLSFTHPITKEKLTFTCDLPQDFKMLIN